ncbi:MAG: glycosyltransferase [Treponema sp.]|jgi:cellulose synthase/poly-beta-1,6-N-acetylglucosamine synthase-like glycosyltransferase|nr:glycosyltransferase [Treponema sp.]
MIDQEEKRKFKRFLVIFLLLYDIFRFGFAFVFAGLHIALMAGLFLEWRRDRLAYSRGSPKEAGGPGHEKPDIPKVSVIIPVHNERLHLAGLLQSLALQDYAAAEFIFIDDRSSDESSELLRGFAPVSLKGGAAPEQARIITLQENPGPNHKQYALGKGIEAASGEFFLFTDADCEVPPGWITAMVTRMRADERIGVTIGPVFKRPGGKGFFHLYQCFDHAVRYMYLAGSTGLGAAGGGFGNNLILRRAALRAIGGYDMVPVSPTEDAALISRIRAGSDYRIRSAAGADLFVLTGCEYSWKALINQTLRWNNGGLFSSDPATRFNFRFLMITISMGIIAIPLLLCIPSLWPLTGAVMFAMTLNTAATLRLFGSALPKKGIAYIPQTVFTPMYFTFLTVLGFCGFKIHWKGSQVP